MNMNTNTNTNIDENSDMTRGAAHDPFDRVIGYDDEKRTFLELCDMARNPGKYASLGVTLPAGLLIHGAPGVGKTLCSEALIEAMGRPCFTLRKTRSSADFVDEITETFAKAGEAGDCVVFLDDIDKFSSDERTRNAEEFVAVQAGMDSVRGKGVFVLATANSTRCLPDSLLRSGRFDRVMQMDVPTHRDAVGIIDHYMKGKRIAGDISAESVSRLIGNRSCAALESVLNEAGMYAAYDGAEEIGREHIVRAALRVIFDTDDDTANEMCAETRREIAYHEAAHAACALAFDPDSVSLVSLHSKGGQGSGITEFFTRDDYFNSYGLMHQRVVCLMAGQAAVEMKFAHPDVGASSDTARALKIAERFVTDYGTSGSRYLTGRGLTESDAQSDGIVSARNEEVERSLSEAGTVLNANWDLVEALAQALIEKGTLIYEDVKGIYASLRPAA